MSSSLKYIKGGISFEEFCQIIDKGELRPGSGSRDGLQEIYDAHKKAKGYVVSGDASLVASTIVAQTLEYEW